MLIFSFSLFSSWLLSLLLFLCFLLFSHFSKPPALVKGQSDHVTFSLTFYKIDIYILGFLTRHFAHFLR